jgi:TonB family protein
MRDALKKVIVVVIIRAFPVVFLLSFCPPLGAHAFPQCKEQGVLSETQIRKIAAEAYMPIYPEESRKKGQTGVAVAEVSLNENDRVTDVRILEAPSPSIARAVKDAVMKWKFPHHEGVVCFKGKLTFYFLLHNGAAFVKNPRRYERR